MAEATRTVPAERRSLWDSVKPYLEKESLAAFFLAVRLRQRLDLLQRVDRIDPLVAVGRDGRQDGKTALQALVAAQGFAHLGQQASAAIHPRPGRSPSSLPRARTGSSVVAGSVTVSTGSSWGG